MYDISLVNDAYEKRQPSGNVMVGIPKPDGLSSNFAIYALEEDGSATDLNAFLTEDGKTLCYYTNNLTAVAIADVVGAPISDDDDSSKEVKDDNDVKDDNAKTGVNDVLPVILVLTFAAVLVLRLKKKAAQK